MKNFKKSYSQSGEDMIISFIFNAMGIDKPSYLDIGANDPYRLSNTAFFYENNSRGINIEPNPILFKRIQEHRKGDINLNIGIGTNEEILNFYVMNVNTMSTFSLESASELCTRYGFYIDKEIQVPIKSINYISDYYFNGKYPDFISLDTEGLDMVILSEMDFERDGAYVICVETIEYSEKFDAKKDEQIIEFLKSKGYRVYADTYINTIFVKSSWIK